MTATLASVADGEIANSSEQADGPWGPRVFFLCQVIRNARPGGAQRCAALSRCDDVLP